MQERRFDIMAPKETQLEMLRSYLEEISEGKEYDLPLTLRTKVLIGRYLWGWDNLYTKDGLTPTGALIYYKKLKEEE